MNLKKIFFSAVTVSVLCALTGCDYIEEGKPESSLLKQEEEHNNKIVLLEKQQAQLKSQLETIQKQQTGIISSTKTLTHVIKSVKDQQNTFAGDATDQFKIAKPFEFLGPGLHH